MRTTSILSVALICVAAACAKSDKSDATDSANAMAAAAGSGAAGTGAAGTGAAGTAGTGAAGTGAAGSTVVPASSCLEGTWKKQDGTFTQTLTFSPNNKGEEVQSRDDKRTFEWGIKNDTTVEIHYTMKNAKNSDWNVTVDCAKNRLSNGVNSSFSK